MPVKKKFSSNRLGKLPFFRTMIFFTLIIFLFIGILIYNDKILAQTNQVYPRNKSKKDNTKSHLMTIYTTFFTLKLETPFNLRTGKILNIFLPNCSKNIFFNQSFHNEKKRINVDTNKNTNYCFSIRQKLEENSAYLKIIVIVKPKMSPDTYINKFTMSKNITKNQLVHQSNVIYVTNIQNVSKGKWISWEETIANITYLHTMFITTVKSNLILIEAQSDTKNNINDILQLKKLITNLKL